MAEIIVSFPLSPKGMAEALLAGRNAGQMQYIILRDPNFARVEPPQDVLLRVLGINLNTATQAPDATLVDAARALAEAVTLLAKVLDPSTTQNITVETATPEVWALAVQLAKQNADGTAHVSCGYDSENYRITGYKAEFQQNTSRFIAKAMSERSGLDRVQTACELIPWEQTRRAALREEEAACIAECQRLAAARQAEVEASRLETDQREVERTLHTYSKWAHLPEAEALREALASSERLNTHDLIWKFSQAVTRAEKALVQAEDSAWINAHGSTLLRRQHADGHNVSALYEAERLALECPGWKSGGSPSSALPTEAEYASLDKARMAHPDAIMGEVRGVGLVPVRKYRDRYIYLP